jgi:hypothetical protein
MAPALWRMMGIAAGGGLENYHVMGEHAHCNFVFDATL